MLMFRAICAVVVAWAVNWVMGQPVAANLLELVPEMQYIAPAAGAIVGFFALAKRQGWGIIVAAANGLWTMIMTVGIAWLIFLTITVGDHVAHGLIADFENFLRILGYEAAPLAEGWVDLRLVGAMLGATVVAGLGTEVLHWILVHIRRMRGENEDDEVIEESEAT
jgi:hypothetical protein